MILGPSNNRLDNTSEDRLGCSYCFNTLNPQDSQPDRRVFVICTTCNQIYHLSCSQEICIECQGVQFESVTLPLPHPLIVQNRHPYQNLMIPSKGVLPVATWVMALIVTSLFILICAIIIGGLSIDPSLEGDISTTILIGDSPKLTVVTIASLSPTRLGVSSLEFTNTPIFVPTPTTKANTITPTTRANTTTPTPISISTTRSDESENSPEMGQIVYASNDEGHWSIYLLDMNSGYQELLLDDGGIDNSAPVWSPDGSQIAFHSNRNGNWDIYVLDITSRQIRRLTTYDGGDLFPTWSPNGTQLAFHRVDNGNYDLFTIDATGNNLRQLTNNPALEASPSWSPNGTQLAYEAQYNGDSDIYLLNLSDLSTETLVSRAGNDEGAQWSPNGEEIAFTSEQGGSYEIFVINADGTNLLQLTSVAGDDVFPAWSPDGTHIIYEHWHDGDSDIFIMRADGSDKEPLIQSDKKTRFPDWL